MEAQATLQGCSSGPMQLQSPSATRVVQPSSISAKAKYVSQLQKTIIHMSVHLSVEKIIEKNDYIHTRHGAAVIGNSRKPLLSIPRC